MLRLLFSIYWEVYNQHRVLLWILLPRFFWGHFTRDVRYYDDTWPDALWST